MKHSIRFEHDALHFSASHFITFDTPEKVEALHGHNFRIRASISGPLNRRAYVVDFLAAFDALKLICDNLSHKVLLPGEHPYIKIKQSEESVDVTLPPLYWSFPKEDTLTLPIRNMTTESLTEYIAKSFRTILEQKGAFEAPVSQYEITIEIEESPGMWAVYQD
jgi:6-pyruvoyltetrahydropterin/6-carboxytetrahydropterin synthase